MRASSTLLPLLPLFLSPTPTTAKYTLKTDLSYKNFFPHFSFFTLPDPTHGFVQYIDEARAFSTGLASLNHETQSVHLGVDNWTKNPVGGRQSVRLESTVSFHHGLLIADITHMPDNECGVWPAFWLLGAGLWPWSGEVDVLEGVNDEWGNTVTVHSGEGCRVDNSRGGLDNCYVYAPDSEKDQGGCSIKPTIPNNYGLGFNLAGGGIYAVEWTSTGISVWFFSRLSPNLPSQDQLESSPDPSTWGPPIAHFSGSGCDFNQNFKDMRIIFNTDFCGEWAGQPGVWGYSCKAKTGYDRCEDYVAENPGAFEWATWEIRGLRLFEKEGSYGKRGEKHKEEHLRKGKRGRRYGF